MLQPRLVAFGYGACETNLGLRSPGPEAAVAEEGGAAAPEAAAAAAAAGEAATDQSVLEQQLFPAKRCAWGSCAGDRGWPANLVKNGPRAANPASSDSPNCKP